MNAEKLTQKISNDRVANDLRSDLNDIQERRNEIMATGDTVKSNTQILKLYKDAETKQIKSLQDLAQKDRAAANMTGGKKKTELLAAINKKLAADIKNVQDRISLDAGPYEKNLKRLSTGKTGGIDSKFTPGQSNFKVS